jgi:hypothetical protein
VKTADAGGPGPLGERGEQRDADAPVLPPVDDLDRHLCGLEVVIEADVARDPDRRARRRRVRDQRLVVPVVDVEEPAQVAGTQDRLGREEALEARALTEPGERERDGPAVRGSELTNRDSRHPASLTRLRSRA